MPGKTASSAFSPFKHRIFAILWTATLISNIGTWMFNVTSGWVMTELSPSPLMVSMVQAATALPVFLFALPAGALGDLLNRRQLLLWTQIFLAFVLFLFAGLLWQGVVNAWVLLLFTFITGAGSAFAMPAWQAIVPRLVPRDALGSAIALNGISMNIARAVGPALGGFILAAAGAVATALLDAVSYLAVVAALLWWGAATTQADKLPREHLTGAMQAGIRFALHSAPLRHTLIHALAFFICASAYWALLPLVAKDTLQGGPSLYGILLTALGIGAVAGAFLLPFMKKHLNANKVMMLAITGTALCSMMLAYGKYEIVGIAAGLIGGVSWLMAVSSLNISAQMALPDWVRARGLAIFQMVFFGAMTTGSLGWGQAAEVVGLPLALAASGLLALFLIPVTGRFKLNLGEHHDHTPSGHWAEPVLITPVAHDHGPVLVTLEYRIDDADRDAFCSLMRELGIIRRRDGAIQWGFFEDVEDHGRFIEVFTVESWLAHLRQHARVSASDKILQDKILALHGGNAPPRVTHAVMPNAENSMKRKIPSTHHDL
ncbi:MFS transporter [Nitrosomonas sp. Nm166]|uniref:MFS transporter n=1 Tax=Nitrosomonas sp. Nm166 TaxID=1881054 RepID=UPI0008EA001B|nr:MFS transporter [Nitrosomonas sp. Nm166]SFE40091.1 Predicted arabinose efflux permease, MFS family [Nitrosomonas sp. Nm166]